MRLQEAKNILKKSGYLVRSLNEDTETVDRDKAVLYKVKEFINNIYDEYNSIPKEEVDSWLEQKQDDVYSIIYDIAEVFGIRYLD